MSLPVTDPVLIVAIAMAAFLLMPLVTDRLRLPDIIGVLLAGVLVGPHGLGLLERDETIHLLGTVGLLYLVFLAGLEVDLGDLSRNRKRAITFGVITFLVPQIIGTICSIVFFDFNFASAVLLGSVFSSHSFLALLIAKRMGLTERELVIAVIGGTVITDTLALFVLAIVAQSASGEFGVLFLLKLILQAGIFATIIVFGLPLLGRWFFRRVTDGGAHFTFMMTVLFTSGYVAHLAGLEPIIGAFLAGLAMNRLVPHHGVLANRAFFVGNTIFVPFFLLSVGMLIDLGMVFSDLRTIEMAAFMTATVIVCKGAAAWMMRLLFGYSRNDSVVAWGLSLPQAATTLAVVLVGHDLKLFDDAVLNATIVMVFVTCILGPVLVQIAGRRIADVAPHLDVPEGEPKLQRILIPLANPNSSHDLLDLAMGLRRPLVDEPIFPMSVAVDQDAVEKSERLLSSCVLHLAAANVPVRPVISVDLNPVNGILRTMTEMRATSLVVGWSGPVTNWQRHFHISRGLIDELIGNTTTQILVVRLCNPLSVIERVVIAIPEHAANEFGFAELIGDYKRLSKRIGASLVLTGSGVKSKEVQEEIHKIAPTVSIEILENERPYDVVDQLTEYLRPADLMVIVGCREGTVSWNNNWNRMATRIAHRAPQVSLSVAYPRLEKMHFTAGAKSSLGEVSLLSHALFKLNTPFANLEELLAQTLPDFDLIATSSNVLVTQLVSSLSAFSDNSALLHAHTPSIEQPRLAVVVMPQPLHHDGVNLRVIFVLINPANVSAEQHLANLATIARLVHDQKRIELLLKASDEDDVSKAQRSLSPSNELKLT